LFGRALHDEPRLQVVGKAHRGVSLGVKAEAGILHKKWET
jgi:hypothetical protein